MVNTGVLVAHAVLLLAETPWILTLESDVAAAEMSGPLMLGPALLFALALLVEVIAELAGIAKGSAAWVFWRKQCDVANRKLEWPSSSKYCENAIPRFPFGGEFARPSTSTGLKHCDGHGSDSTLMAAYGVPQHMLSVI
ncbi:hypothetical protein PC119_g11805 [Phytophthora cactorum]|nr:hypothetical protein PC119_g11805 [Phytophthora cactorum]